MSERIVSRLQRDCLDRLLIFSDQHFHWASREYVTYCNHVWSHQGIAERIPVGLRVEKPPKGTGKIVAFSVLNSLLSSDYLRHWGNAPNDLLAELDTVRRTAAHIIDHIERVAQRTVEERQE